MPCAGAAAVSHRGASRACYDLRLEGEPEELA